MKNSTLALTAGILSAVFMTANPAWTEPPQHNHDQAPAEMQDTQRKMVPFMTVRARFPGSVKLSSATIGDPVQFRTFIEGLKTGPDVQIDLDGAVITEDGTFGYISVFEGWDFSGMDLSGVTIRNAVFLNAKTAKTNFDNAKLVNVMLAGIKAPGSTWRNVVFDTTDPAKAVRGGGCIQGAETDMRYADFSGAQFIGMNWENSDFEGAKLPPVIKAAVRNSGQPDEQRIETSFEGASLSYTIMLNSTISETNMSNVSVKGADMRNATFLNMKGMTDMEFDNNTKLAGAKFINATPPYPLILLQQKQEAAGSGAPSPGIR